MNIAEKLLRRHQISECQGVPVTAVVNPDGPEAAAVIESLVEALERQVNCEHYETCKFKFAPFPDCPDCRPRWKKEADKLLAKVSRT